MSQNTNMRLFSRGGLLFSTAAAAACLTACSLSGTEAFAPPTLRSSAVHSATVVETSTALFNRKDRRANKKKKVRTQPGFVDDDDDAPPSNSAAAQEPILMGGGDIGSSNEVPESQIPLATRAPKTKKPSKLDQELAGERIDEEGIVGESVTSSASVSDMPTLPGMEQPDVSQIVTDPDTGIARIEQGKFVMDKVTGKAVVLSSLGPEYRLAQMFPGVPADVREQYRFDWNTITVPEMVEKMKAACTVPLKNSKTGKEWSDVPPHPQISNPSADFVLANRDYLGHRMKKALGRLKLRAQSQFNKEEASELRKLWKHFLLLEDHVSAPFRQMVLNAEAKVGPNFGNLDVKSYCGGELYERTSAYLVLKSMVAHWEKKYADAQYLESIAGNDNDDQMNFLDELYTGDPKRYLPDPPIIFRLAEVSRIVAMAQKMVKVFVETPELFDDMPPEVKFVESALSIKGGTALRKHLIEDFCPANDIDPASLREGLRRLYQQMFNLQTDPYGDLTMTLWNLCAASAVGTDDAREPYKEYIANVQGTGYDSNPGFFQTYTFNHDKNSLVRFLDTSKKIERGTAGPAEDIQRQIQGEAAQLFGFNMDDPAKLAAKRKAQELKPYVPPEDRAIGRPHMMGWLDLLGEDEELTGGEKEGEEKFEADNWVAVN